MSHCVMSEKERKGCTRRQRFASVKSTNLLSLDLEVAQNDSHVSFNLLQKILNLISGGSGPVELLHETTGPLKLSQDTVQLGDKIICIIQDSVHELLSQTLGRLGVALQKLSQALSRMSADTTAYYIPPWNRSQLTSSCGRQFATAPLRRLISSGALLVLLMIWKQKIAVFASPATIERTAAGSAMIALGLVIVKVG